MNGVDRLIVLLVEPHQLVRRLLRDILRVLGVAQTHAVDTIEDAVQFIAKTPVNLIISDWSPSTDALALLRLLRAPDSPNPYIPIIVMTPFADRKHVRQARDAGVDEYMLKPFAPQTVESRLRSLTEHPRPFVKIASFFGPDRRRHRGLDFPGPERRRRAAYVDRRFHEIPFTGSDRRRPKSPDATRH